MISFYSSVADETGQSQSHNKDFSPVTVTSVRATFGSQILRLTLICVFRNNLD